MKDHHHHHGHHHHHAAHHTFPHPHFRSAEFHGHHRHPGRGLHWVGLAVLATTFIRKGKGEPVFWFGLGALVTSLFMKYRASLENAWSHRCHSGRLGNGKKRGVSWKLTVVGDADEEDVRDAHDSSHVHNTCRDGVSSPAADDHVCACGYVAAKDATRAETLFDATDHGDAGEHDDHPSPASNEPRAGEAAPSAAQQPVSVFVCVLSDILIDLTRTFPTLKTLPVESRIDSLARTVEEIRLVSTRVSLTISISLSTHPHASTAYLPVGGDAELTKVEHRLQRARRRSCI
jgi:hypothetical protein